MAEIQGLEYILKAFKTIVELGSNFAKDIKEKGNWKQADFSQEELDYLAIPLHIANKLQQTTKADQKAIYIIIAKLWDHDNADYIWAYNLNKRFV